MKKLLHIFTGIIVADKLSDLQGKNPLIPFKMSGDDERGRLWIEEITSKDEVMGDRPNVLHSLPLSVC